MAWRLIGFLFACGIASGQVSESSGWTVTGTVLDSISGQPIAGAQVIWEPSFAAFGFRDRPAESAGPAPNAARIVTSSAGTFTLSIDPTATGVRLFVSRQGYSAQDGKESASLSVAAAPSQSLAIRLAPKSILEGHVLNSAGEPVPGVDVRAVHIDIKNGLRQAREDFASVSGPGGEFHFEGLPVGAYYLRASGLFYPSATTADRARLFDLTPGKTFTLDFHIEPHKLNQIRGLITNMPLRKTVSIRLVRDGDPLTNPFSMSPNGNFQVLDVDPGSYTLQAYTPGAVPPDFGEADVVVGDGDVAALKVSLSEGVDVSGHIEFRGSGSLEKYAVVHAAPFVPRRLPVDYSEIVATMRPNGDFVFKNILPGKYEVTVRGAPDVYMAEAVADSKNILDQGLTVDTKDPPPLAIVMRSGGGEISGNIDLPQPGSTASYSVALITRYGSVEIPTVVHALNGHFHIGGLSPGDYSLLAWPDSEDLEYRNHQVLSDLSVYKTALSVAEGARRTVTLTPVP